MPTMYELEVSGYQPYHGVMELEQLPTPRDVWWVPHDVARYNYDNQIGGGWRFNPKINGLARKVARDNHRSFPEVYRMYPLHGTKLGPPEIKLIVDSNPELSAEKALSILGPGLAFCNGKWGTLDQPRLMGGALVTGTTSYSVVQGINSAIQLALEVGFRQHTFMSAKQEFKTVASTTHNILAIKSLRLGQPLPSADQVMADPTLFFWCVGVQPDGDVNMWWRRGEDGLMHNVRMLYITNQQTYSRLDELYKLPPGFVPSPQWKPTPV